MGLPVASHKARPVNGKHHRKVLDAHVMEDLVIGPMQKGGIHRKHRPKPRRSQTGRKGNPMGLRNPHIKKTIREHILEPLQACPVRHGCRDSHQPLIPISHFPHHRRKNVGIIGLAPLLRRQSRLDLKGLGPMEPGRVPLCRQIPLSLLGDGMHQHCPINSGSLS